MDANSEHSEHYEQAVLRGEGATVVVAALSVDDPVLAELLDAQPPGAWPELVRRALRVGACGLVDMGLGVDLRGLDDRVRATLEGVAGEAEERARATLAAAGEAIAIQLDPELRSSLVARAIDEFGAVRDRLLAQLDPELAGSHAGRFIGEVTGLLGPGGRLSETLAAALDPDVDGSALAKLAASVDTRFQELRDLLMRESGGAAVAARGTAKGADYEDTVEARLRELVRGSGAVERVGRLPGELGGEAMVGDFVVTLGSGARIVVEAKNAARLDLAGRKGILGELDRALANRKADFAVCVSAQEAFPAEVGHFWVSGDRLLVVDGGDGMLLEVAMRWAEARLAATPGGADELDRALVEDRLTRLEKLAQRFVSGRRTLSDVRNSVERVREELDGMRADLLDVVADLGRELRSARREEGVVRVA